MTKLDTLIFALNCMLCSKVFVEDFNCDEKYEAVSNFVEVIKRKQKECDKQ